VKQAETYFLFKTQAMLLLATRRKGHQMLTYILFKTQSMLWSATSRKGQPDAYSLFKTQSMLLSTTSREGQPDADLQAGQNPEHAFVSNKKEGPAKC
jgi:hypothetical protein